jgi:hypothetical protein
MTGKLPTFPDLEPIELRNLPDIRAIAAVIPSSSDFTAGGLWTWDASGPYRVAQLHGNLVVEFRHYVSGEAFLSFNGTSEVANTSLTLLNSARRARNLSDELRLIPEHTVEQLRGDSRFFFEQEHDERDYLYSPQVARGLEGTVYRPIRQQINRFDRASDAVGGVEITEAPPELLASDRKAFEALLERWSAGTSDGVECSVSERKAIARLCETVNALRGLTDLHLHVAAKGDELFGFALCEVVTSNVLTSHFLKSDNRLPGLSARFFMEQVRFAYARDITVLNWEQDLGIPGLRDHKLSLRPSGYLHKYRVSLAAD